MTTFDIMQTIFNFFAILYIHRFMIAFFDNAEKRSEKCLSILYLVYPFLTSIMYFGTNYPILNVIANVISLFVISLQYRVAFEQRIIAIGMIYFTMLIVESACTVATNYIGASLFHVGTYKNIVGLVIFNLLIFAVSLVVFHLKNMKKSTYIPHSLWLAITVIPISSITAILMILHNSSIHQIQAIFIIVMFLVINGCTFFLYDALIESYNTKLQTVLLAEEKEYYYNQCQYMQQSEQEMRAFRHDIQNQLDMIYEFMKQESSEQIEQCTFKIADRLHHSELFSNTNHIALDSILNLKLTQAHNKGIHVTCDSSVPEDLQLDSSDLMVILGNLLDNAITAAEKIENNAFISVQVIYDKGMLFITIENSYDGQLKETNGRLLSTKANKEYHGFGIKNIKKTLEQYHGLVEFRYTENVFCVDTALYCKSVE